VSTVRSRALACLREGRVTILLAEPSDDGPAVVLAAVGSSRTGGPTYAVDFTPRNGWTCTCNRPDCPHVAAVQIVTGQAARVAL